MEGESKSLSDAVVGHREDVRAAHAEDQEHFDGPRADAADLGESFDDVGVRHFADGCVGGNGSVKGPRSQVAEGLDLVARDAGGAQGLVGRVEEELGGRIAAEVLADAAVNGGRGFAVQLLVEDGLEEGLEGRGSWVETKGERACAVNECGEFGIGSLSDGLWLHRDRRGVCGRGHCESWKEFIARRGRFDRQ